jgi:hypothetical protein
MFSLGTDSQDTSRRGSQQLQQDLAHSFNDMRVSPSSSANNNNNTLPSRSRSSQLPSSPYGGRDGNLAPQHHLQPSHSFSTLPTRNPPPETHSSQRSPHSSQSIALPHHPPEQQPPAPVPPRLRPLLLPRQLHSLRHSKRVYRQDGSSDTTRADVRTTSTTTHA